jgi:hypothetical protein
MSPILFFCWAGAVLAVWIVGWVVADAWLDAREPQTPYEVRLPACALWPVAFPLRALHRALQKAFTPKPALEAPKPEPGVGYRDVK